MLKKKKYLIKAFEDLDISMLDLLISENSIVENVSKEIFLEAYRKHFSWILEDKTIPKTFKAYSGYTTHEGLEKPAYAFINSEGSCHVKLILQENNWKSIDIYQCYNFCSSEIEIVESFISPYFYADDRTDYFPSYDNIHEQNQCVIAINEFYDEVNREGILGKKFYIPWRNKYKNFDSIRDIFQAKRYRYRAELLTYTSLVSHIIDLVIDSALAKAYLDDFAQLDKSDKELLSAWFANADTRFKFAKFGFEKVVNEKANYFIDRGFKFALDDVLYYYQLCSLFKQYHNALPSEIKNANPWHSVGDFNTSFGIEEDSAF